MRTTYFLNILLTLVYCYFLCHFYVIGLVASAEAIGTNSRSITTLKRSTVNLDDIDIYLYKVIGMFQHRAAPRKRKRHHGRSDTVNTDHFALSSNQLRVFAGGRDKEEIGRYSHQMRKANGYGKLSSMANNQLDKKVVEHSLNKLISCGVVKAKLIVDPTHGYRHERLFQVLDMWNLLNINSADIVLPTSTHGIGTGKATSSLSNDELSSNETSELYIYSTLQGADQCYLKPLAIPDPLRSKEVSSIDLLLYHDLLIL